GAPRGRHPYESPHGVSLRPIGAGWRIGENAADSVHLSLVHTVTVLVATVPPSGERVEPGRGVGGLFGPPCTVRIKGRRDGEARRSTGRAHAIRPRRCSDASRSQMRRSTARSTASTRRARLALLHRSR